MYCALFIVADFFIININIYLHFIRSPPSQKLLGLRPGLLSQVPDQFPGIFHGFDVSDAGVPIFFPGRPTPAGALCSEMKRLSVVTSY